jgi:hypothetical protein
MSVRNDKRPLFAEIAEPMSVRKSYGHTIRYFWGMLVRLTLSNKKMARCPLHHYSFVTQYYGFHAILSLSMPSSWMKVLFYKNNTFTFS